MGSGVDCSARKSNAGSPLYDAISIKNNIVQDLLLLDFWN